MSHKSNIPRTKRQQKPSGRVRIHVKFIDEQYRGLARLIPGRALVVEFPWKGKKNHRCWITPEDVVDWRDNKPPTKKRKRRAKTTNR